MFRYAALVFFACAAPTSRTSSPRRSIPHIPATPLRTSTPACLPSTASAVTHLGGDAHAVHACFDQTCLSLDRRTGATSAWTPPRDPDPPAPDVRIEEQTNAFEVCVLQGDCVDVYKRDGITRESIAVAHTSERAFTMVTLVDQRGIDPLRIDIYSYSRAYSFDRYKTLDPHDGNRCGTARFLDDDHVLVVTDDCAGGPGRGYLFGTRGQLIGAIDHDGRTIDMRDSDAIRAGARWAIVLPHEYAVMITNVPMLRRHDLVDLVPIQAESTTTPAFAIALASDGALVVASPTGGLGTIDPKTLALTPHILPRCPAPSSR
jgi:hypothetical protein